MFPPDLHPNFDIDALRKLLIACGAVYSKPAEAEAIARANGATEFWWFSDTHTSTQGFIAASGFDLVIAFCGTKDVRDWVTDCKFILTPDDNFPGRVHDGFGDAYNAVRSSVLEIVDQWLRRPKPAVHKPDNIWITGHSLGGALAMLCGYDLVRGGIPIAGIYTLGQPRVGDKHFATEYDCNPMLHGRTFRIVNEEDIVPRVPGVLMGYRHAAHELFLNEFNGVDIDPSFCRKFASDFWGIAVELSKNTREKAVAQLVTDHFLDAYKKRINQQ